MRLFAVSVSLLALPVFHSSIKPVPASVQREVTAGHHWHAGCPVKFSGLRLLTVSYWGFDNESHNGQLIVNANAAPSLAKVFERLYAMRFPIRHMALADEYGSQPADGDITYSMSCRQAVPSPCAGGSGTGTWSMHAYGEAVDINPVENPYVGCGMTRDKTALSYLDRSRVRRGMVTPSVLRAFESVGWAWGGSWSGSTKDYMHFSSNGH